jgi:hypothetical protein
MVSVAAETRRRLFPHIVAKSGYARWVQIVDESGRITKMWKDNFPAGEKVTRIGRNDDTGWPQDSQS